MSTRCIEREAGPVMEMFVDVLERKSNVKEVRAALDMLNEVYKSRLGAIVMFCFWYGIDPDGIVDIVRRRIDMEKEGL